MINLLDELSSDQLDVIHNGSGPYSFQLSRSYNYFVIKKVALVHSTALLPHMAFQTAIHAKLGETL